MIAKEEINFFIFLSPTCHRIRDGSGKGSGEWGVGNGTGKQFPCSHSPFPSPHSLLFLCPFCFFSSRYSKRASEPSGLPQATPFSLYRGSDPSPPDAGKFVEEVGRARIEGEMHVERAGKDVLTRDEAPIAAVFAVVAAVAHHEVLVLGHLDRFAHAIDRPGIDLKVVSAGIPVDVVEDFVPRAFGLRFDFDDWQFRLLR